jgi:hypothetical protein
MLYITISSEENSAPNFHVGGNAVNKHVYVNMCLKILLLFVCKYHRDRPFVFWPDKASSHYSKLALNFLEESGINYVTKVRNPTNLPQCRPIEDFFGTLAQKVYDGSWNAKSAGQLQNRIRYCLKKMDKKVVRDVVANVPNCLKKCGQEGPHAVAH